MSEWSAEQQLRAAEFIEETRDSGIWHSFALGLATWRKSMVNVFNDITRDEREDPEFGLDPPSHIYLSEVEAQDGDWIALLKKRVHIFSVIRRYPIPLKHTGKLRHFPPTDDDFRWSISVGVDEGFFYKTWEHTIGYTEFVYVNTIFLPAV